LASKNVNYLSFHETLSLQEEPGTHVSPSRIKSWMSHKPVRRKGYKHFKGWKPFMNDGTRKRRVERAAGLWKNSRRIHEWWSIFCFLGWSEFPLQIPTNPQNKGQKQDIPDENLFRTSHRQSVKVMVSAGFDVTRCYKTQII